LPARTCRYYNLSMLKISGNAPASPAASCGIFPGDELLRINGHDIQDLIDYRYFQSDSEIEMLIRRAGSEKAFRLVKNIDQDLGLQFYPDRIIRCRNKCLFCFCHNNPKKLRRSLYIKDDDYRRSFLHGSFVTLTNLSDSDFDRIIKLRLSPLYISVQTTDEIVRSRLFGRANLPPILPLLRKFADNDIYFHCQVVIVPGYNGGEILRKTAADLAGLRPHASSLAIVPVGLTDFSDPRLRPAGPKLAASLIAETGRFRRLYGGKSNNFAYAADELFIKAGIDIPPENYYDDSPQIENGIGMVRDFLTTIPARIPPKIGGVWVTGASMKKIWQSQAMHKLSRRLKLIPVANRLFGPRVTVTGLLSGSDILHKLSKIKLNGQPLVLPPNCLNTDGLFLDDLTISDLEEELKVKIVQGSYSLKETLKLLS